MTYKVFIDGRSGTTGLKIDERLATRSDVEVMTIPDAARKDPKAKAEYINAADVVFLCLPDAAAKESVALLAPDNTRTRVLDASTAHRVAAGWVYGLPEISAAHRKALEGAQKVAVPGCHASGFILAMAPLVASGVVPADYPASVHSVTGYTGGGKEMIATYEEPTDLPDSMLSPRQYALGLAHKHLPEMAALSGLQSKPLFNPIVGPFAQGMLVTVPLFPRLLPGKQDARAIHDVLAGHYAGQTFVKIMPFGDDSVLDGGFLPATNCNGTNRAEIFVFGHAEQAQVCVRLDNLGKGASGAAIQCMNIVLGLDEATGLLA
ncbi:MAG: N-acetyl-gamma-glutamyl-phosphate reductase [Moraxellaceae bacterium]|nr:N-acetyl-gamma-glutamyl-phosphate reductase [Moraxellaceae bacterium]